MNDTDKKNYDDWESLADTPEEFAEAIRNAISPNERVFFEKLRYKELNETAFSNDVLMHERDNDDGLYILRVYSDNIMIGNHITEPEKAAVPQEYEGLFFVLKQDLFSFLGRHVTLHEWLRERDYEGIRYDQNNDYR